MLDFDLYFKDLEKLISFDTSLNKDIDLQRLEGKEKPFGETTYKALAFFLSRANDFGFSTINYENFAGEVYCGEGQDIGIIGHLDVVPAGEVGWSNPPFTLTLKDNALYGRGVMDDKGAVLLCLYALKELKDSGIKFNRKIRLIVGCNEETGWKDIEYLQKRANLPEYGFSPDGDFPLAYSEKGVYHIIITLPKFKNFTDIKGGTVINAVCGKASVKSLIPVNYELLKKYGLTEKENIIESVGISCHGAHPELGKNALKNLFLYMRDMGEDISALIPPLFDDSLGISEFKNEQGLTTFSPDVIKEEKDGITLLCDLRVPAPVSISELTSKVFDKMGVKYKIIEKHPPVMLEKDGWFVQTLINAYNSVTNENAKPMPMAGSTFARAFKKGCAFGPAFANDDGGCHEPNEHCSVENIKKAYEIYKKAIYELIKQ